MFWKFLVVCAGAIVLFFVYVGVTTSYRQGWDRPKTEAGAFILHDECNFRTVVSCDVIPGTSGLLYSVVLKDRVREDYTTAFSNKVKAVGELVGYNELYNPKDSQRIQLIVHGVKPPL